MIADTRKILDSAATDQDHGVLLQVVTFTADVGTDFIAVGQAHAAHLTQSRVRLLGRSRVDAGADPTALRTSLQRRYVAGGDRALARLAHELVDRCHSV